MGHPVAEQVKASSGILNLLVDSLEDKGVSDLVVSDVAYRAPQDPLSPLQVQDAKVLEEHEHEHEDDQHGQGEGADEERLGVLYSGHSRNHSELCRPMRL